MGRLFEEHSNYLLAVISRLMGPALARTLEPADVLQETLLVASARFSDFQGTDERELRTWLAAIARRKLIDLARHNGRLKRALKGRLSLDEPQSERGESLADSLPSDICTASQFAVKREMSDKLAEALTTLEPRDAEVMKLRYVDGMTLEEIGSRVGTGRNGVRGIIARGLKSLRRLLPS